MTQVDVIFDKDSFKQAERALRDIPGGLPVAGRRAANRTAKTGTTRVGKLLSNIVGAKVRGVTDAVNIHKATTSHPSATVSVKKRGINLIYFGATWGGRESAGVSSRIAPPENQTVAGRKGRFMLAHAFIEPGLGGKRLVFIGTGVKRIQKRGRYAGRLREVIAGVRGMTAQELLRHVPGALHATAAGLQEVMQKEMAAQVHYLCIKAGRVAGGDE